MLYLCERKFSMNLKTAETVKQHREFQANHFVQYDLTQSPLVFRVYYILIWGTIGLEMST